MKSLLPIPPKEMIFVGDGDFEQIGEKWKRYFVEQVHLIPTAKVLDVGCGIGRIARPLTGYLTDSAEYRGFDIVKEGILWCQQNITPRFPNFEFKLSDVYNKYYNPTGTVRACDYKFPFDDGYFDFVFLTSVFTHMLPEDVENYLCEISRVLKKHSTCTITFFLLNDQTRQLIYSNNDTINFGYKISDTCFSTDNETPETALAYDEEFIIKIYQRYKLRIIKAIEYGGWRRNTPRAFYQDIICAVKL